MGLPPLCWKVMEEEEDDDDDGNEEVETNAKFLAAVFLATATLTLSVVPSQGKDVAIYSAWTALLVTCIN